MAYNTYSHNPKIINVQTGEIREVDYYKIREMRMPEGFKSLDDVTKEELAEMIREWREEVNRLGGSLYL